MILKTISNVTIPQSRVTKRKMLLGYATLPLMITLTSIAQAELQPNNVEAMKACIAKNVAIEAEKEDRNADAVLERCRSDIKKVLRDLPNGADDEVYHNLRHNIDSMLAK